jgi:serine/threonine protein kinase
MNGHFGNRYVENGSLLHTLRAFGNLPEALVASYVVKILEGLDYLHSKQVCSSGCSGERYRRKERESSRDVCVGWFRSFTAI